MPPKVPRPGRGAKYLHLLEDIRVRRWYDDTARGSQITADVYLRRLGFICQKLRKTPADLLALDKRKAKDLMLDLVSSEERQGHSGTYVDSVVRPIRSLLSFNGTSIEGRIKIRGREATPTLENEPSIFNLDIGPYDIALEFISVMPPTPIGAFIQSDDISWAKGI